VRTAANCVGGVLVTRYGSTKKARSSRYQTAGNLAGNSGERLLKALNYLRKFPELESSPGHHIFFIYQINITLP